MSAVEEAVGEVERVADLFAGVGTFALPLAQRALVHAVEGEAQMVEALHHGWRMGEGLKPVTVEARDLYRRPLLPDELRRFDAAVLDPPRAGAERQVAELITASVPFARDAAALSGAGYRLEWVQVVDQFRWSSHVELAGCFVLKR